MDTRWASDDALIAAFCDAGDDVERQRSFSALVERHGPMVLGACRRIAGNGTDAEDAAQAVFITLAAKARSLRGHPTLGGWLHRVARNVALRQREAARNRSRYEAHQEAQAMTSPPDGLDERLRGELRETLDHALDALAERYRVPLVLHYLEGHSQEEVARLLDLKEGTLASLLSRGRELLRHQLSRKGVTVGALVLLGVLAAEGPASAAVPAAFTLATAKAASAIAAGSFSTAAALGTAAPHVIALTKGGLSTMALLKITAAATIAAGTLSIGTLAVANYAIAAETPPAPAEVVGATPTVPAPPSDPQNLDQSGAEEAVRSAIRALRTNDAKAFLSRLPESDQRHLERGWQQVGNADGNPWVTGMFNRVLRASTGADGAQQVGNFITPFLAMIEPQAVAQQVADLNGAKPDAGDRRRGGGLSRMIVQSGISAVVSGLLAYGIENEQTRALQRWFTALAGWLPASGLNDPAKAHQAAEALSAALGKLGATSISDLGKLELTQVLERVALAMPELKRVLAVYGLQLDQALDSVQVASRDLPEGAHAPGVNARLVTVTFDAFGTTHVLPLKLVEHEGRWQVSADSPVTQWLRPRGGDFDPRLMGGGQRGGPGMRGGGPGGGGFGGGGQRGGEAPAEPVAKPEANPGF
jgi:RNA polymerase sigma factor (sigma-70 family)